MRPESILEGIGVALLLSVVTLPIYTLIGLRGVVCVGVLGYIVYLVWRRRSRLGSLIALLLASAFIGGGLLLPIAFTDYVLLSVGALWLTRSLMSYQSLLSAAADLALVLVGLGIAFWVSAQGGSVFVVVWSFFLIQALAACIPSKPFQKPKVDSLDESRQACDFSKAKRLAEAALESMTARM